jgi:importin subunit beta-1
LQAIGFICETIVRWVLSACCQFYFAHVLGQDPSVLSTRSNEILTAVVHGARKEETSPEVQLAAITALKNSLEFVRDNFEREVSVVNAFLGFVHVRL